MKTYLLASGFTTMAFLVTAGLVQAKAVPNSVSRPVATTKVSSVTGSFASLAELLKDLPLDLHNGYSDEQMDEIIAEYHINLEKGEKVPKGLNKTTVLRLKLLSYLTAEQIKIVQYSSVFREDISSMAINPENYQKVLFDIDFTKKKYIIYPDINAENFSSLRNQYGDTVVRLYGDDRFLYAQTNGLLNRFKGIDLASFKPMSDIWNNDDEEMAFYSDRSRIYYTKEGNLYEIAGSDALSFSRLAVGYKDRKNVYYYDAKNKVFKTIPGADPATFRIMPLVYGNLWARYSTDLWKDKYAVYYFDAKNSEWRRMKNFDVSKANFIFGGITKYKSKVFYINSVTPEPVKVTDDAAHFTAIPRSANALYSDAKNIYAYSPKNNTISKLVVDKNSFKLLTDSTGRDPYPIIFKDKNAVYSFDKDYKQIKIKMADQATFEILYDGYNIIAAKDKNNVYYYPSPGFDILPDADPETFEVVRYGGVAYAKDKNRVYVANRRDYRVHVLEDSDPQTFAIVKVGNWYYYGRDGQGHIWLYDNNSDEVMKISGENPDSFDYEAHAKEYFGG